MQMRAPQALRPPSPTPAPREPHRHIRASHASASSSVRAAPPRLSPAHTHVGIPITHAPYAGAPPTRRSISRSGDMPEIEISWRRSADGRAAQITHLPVEISQTPKLTTTPKFPLHLIGVPCSDRAACSELNFPGDLPVRWDFKGGLVRPCGERRGIASLRWGPVGGGEWDGGGTASG